MTDQDSNGPVTDLAALQTSLHDLEQRVAVLEGRQTFAPEPAPTPGPTSETYPADVGATPVDGLSTTRVLSLLGRSLVFLAGAFLLRALTDRGALPVAAGFGLGLAYSLVLIYLADRAGGRNDRIGGNLHGLTALIIGFPFVWETTAVLDLVSPLVGCGALAVLTAAGLGVAWHRHLRFLYWAFVLAALVTTVALYAGTGAAVICTWLLLALGAASVFFSYGRGWYLARWPVALVVDAVILRLVIMSTNPGGATAGGQPVSSGAIQTLSLALLVVYLGIFVYRALMQGRGVKAFDVVQSLLVIGVGYGGAAHMVRASGGGTLLGWAALATAFAGYGIAFTVVRQRHGRGRAFFYFATLAMLFLVLGSDFLVSGRLQDWSWIVLGLAAAMLGGHFDRVTLRTHAAVYLALASLRTGLFAAAIDAFTGDPAADWTDLGPSALVALAVTGACYVLLVRTCGDVSRWRRVPRFLIATTTLMGLGYVAVILGVRLVTDAPPDASPAAVAVVRTAVLSVTAVVLALVGRRSRVAELGWLVYPVLALGGLKLVIEDLSRGNPVSLTVAFALYGAALSLAPRILRGGRTAED